MQRYRKLTTICCAAVLTLGLAACGGGGDDTPVTETQQYMDLKQMADGYKADAERLQGELNDANDRIGSADDPNSLTGMLAAATARIGSADDPDSLLGMLAAEQAKVTTLMTTLGDETNPDAASVRGQLAAAMARIGSADDATSLLGQIASLTARIGSADDSDSLLGMLAAERARIGSETDAPDSSSDASLHAQLNAAKARIAELEGGTAPDQLGPIVTAAMTASGLAADAETHADEAADEAEVADDNRATIQTGEADSVADAMAARTAANTAMTEAGKALAAYNTANNAANVADAREARDDAEDARDAAIEAQGVAEDSRDEAVADAMVELKIDGTVKSVGDIQLDADAPNNVVTRGTGANQTTQDTGLQAGLKPTQTVDAITGVAFVAAVAPAADTEYVQAVAERSVDIGKVVDSADDMARLMIVTHYAGSKNAKVFAYNEADPAATAVTAGRVSTSLGTIITNLGTDTAIGGTGGDADTTMNLRSVGTFYLAGEAADTDGLANTDVVGAQAKSSAVYSYVSDQGNTDPADDVTVYLVLDSQRTEGGRTFYVYRSVDITADASDATVQGTAEEVQVTAKLAEATEYDHIHFGVWAALGDAGKALQNPSDLGIGFVQSIGDGMTGDDDMPNFGTATYNGNWAGTVQEADPDGNGAISLTSGAATMTADFNDNEVMVDLTGLAMLEGDISGGTFSGTKATVAADNTQSLTGGEDFTGSFSGAFFGATASEAGGVFDFESEDNEAGAFRGAFGGAR
ncbi:MAG: transferrin-binding protein-like solute binding protein [Defluviicoccus sp.]|nr:transferrin-binding protein-like solute binding protein [Defluviicoccus sp.]